MFFKISVKEESHEKNWVSEYKPTHVVDVTQSQDGNFVQAEIDSFKMLDETKMNPADYGYRDQRAYDRAKRTKVWYIFDKVKRRFYLYADNDWEWPIWVIDDPYHLPMFYPLRRLQYHTDPRMNRTKGEVSNYLDQQDIINITQDEKMRGRTLLRDNTLFDSNALDAKTVEDIMNNANKFHQRVERARSDKEYIELLREATGSSFLSYRVDPKKLNEDDFRKLSGAEKQRLLLELIDNNTLYANYEDINDPSFKVSDKDKEFNKKLYE